jgi:hypothetical protein
MVPPLHAATAKVAAHKRRALLVPLHDERTGSKQICQFRPLLGAKKRMNSAKGATNSRFHSFGALDPIVGRSLRSRFVEYVRRDRVG